MNYKYLISQSQSPYRNLACEQALFGFCGRKEAILFLWQNHDTIVIGRNQDVYAECKADEFIAEGGSVARRESGGGAVYHDNGNLNYSVICLREDSERADHRKIIFGALQSVGIDASFNGRNDIILHERKISGSAEFCIGNVVCQHGTLLVNTDITRMTRFLTPDAEKLRRNAVDSVSSRVMNISDEYADMTVSTLAAALIDFTGADPFPPDILNENGQLATLEKFFGSHKWIYGGKK